MISPMLGPGSRYCPFMAKPPFMRVSFDQVYPSRRDPLTHKYRNDEGYKKIQKRYEKYSPTGSGLLLRETKKEQRMDYTKLPPISQQGGAGENFLSEGFSGNSCW